MVTIFTPSYNRAHTLPMLYKSLCKQTCKNFEWLIVDDGSTDNTEEIISEYKSQTLDFPILYHKKENGGKHTAINRGVELAKGELFFIVDSDDVLTSDAVATILNDWKDIRDKNLCGISYLRGYSETEVIGDEQPVDHGIDNFVNVRFNLGIGGDKAEVWVTEYLRLYPYPVFEGEKFFGETWLWIKLARERDMLWVNKIIYITEYLEGGLSKSGRALRIKCPMGGLTNALELMSKEFTLKNRIKQALLYEAYSFFAKRSLSNIFDMPYKMLVAATLPIGYLLHLNWKKYM